MSTRTQARDRGDPGDPGDPGEDLGDWMPARPGKGPIPSPRRASATRVFADPNPAPIAHTSPPRKGANARAVPRLPFSLIGVPASNATASPHAARVRSHTETAVFTVVFVTAPELGFGKKTFSLRARELVTVSYTHLTLPTILLV